MNRIQINASKSYEVLLSDGLLASAGEHIASVCKCSKKLCIVTDDIVDPLYTGILEDSLQRSGFETCKFVFTHGEASKNLATAGELLEFLAANQLTRTDSMVALGGGVVGDLTGFTAATYLRGIDFIQIPTTLLAAVDSSVGGKTGVNLSAGKNLVGAFWQPAQVLFDVDTIGTLPQEQRLDGIAEAVKAAIIADADLFQFLTHELNVDNSQDLIHMVSRSIEIKRKVVEADEMDKGVRQLLNLGHTIGHAIEKCSNYSISHGHGVAMGMAIIAKASAAEGLFDEDCAQQMISGLKGFAFPLSCPYSAADLEAAALNDKKRAGDHITLVIPEEIGNCRLHKIEVSQLADFIEKGL